MPAGKAISLFSKTPKLFLQPTQASRTVVSTSGCTSEVNWPWHENDHSSQSNGAIRNERRCLATTSYVPGFVQCLRLLPKASRRHPACMFWTSLLSQYTNREQHQNAPERGKPFYHYSGGTMNVVLLRLILVSAGLTKKIVFVLDTLSTILHVFNYFWGAKSLLTL